MKLNATACSVRDMNQASSGNEAMNLINSALKGSVLDGIPAEFLVAASIPDEIKSGDGSMRNALYKRLCATRKSTLNAAHPYSDEHPISSGTNFIGLPWSMFSSNC